MTLFIDHTLYSGKLCSLIPLTYYMPLKKKGKKEREIIKL